MDLDWWRNASNVALIIGIVISAFGTFGSVYFGLKVDKAQKKADQELRNELTKSKNEVAYLHEKVAPRRLSPDQRKQFLNILGRSPGHPIFVACRLMDGESCDFAEDLASALREAHWSVKINRTSLNDFVGVAIFSNSEAGQLPGFDALIDALSAANIEYKSMPVPENSIGEFPSNMLFLVVGRKPI